MTAVTVKISLSDIEINTLLLQIVPVATCPLHVAACEERVSILLADAF